MGGLFFFSFFFFPDTPPMSTHPSIQGLSRLRRTRTKWELAREASPTCLKGRSSQSSESRRWVTVPIWGLRSSSSEQAASQQKTPDVTRSLPVPPCFSRSRTTHGVLLHSIRNRQNRPLTPNPLCLLHLAVKERKDFPHTPPPISSLNAGQGLRPYYPRLRGRGWGIAAHIMAE